MTAAYQIDPNNPACPKCGGRMWDNRESKRNPKQPDFKCRDKSCEGVIWPPRNAAAAPRPAAPQRQAFSIGAAPQIDDPYAVPAPAPAAPVPPVSPEVQASVNSAVQWAQITALHEKCFAHAVQTYLKDLTPLGGDTAGALVAITHALFIEANRKGVRA